MKNKPLTLADLPPDEYQLIMAYRAMTPSQQRAFELAVTLQLEACACGDGNDWVIAQLEATGDDGGGEIAERLRELRSKQP